VLSGLLTAERLGSYLRWSGGDLKAAFMLYEWNMTASAAVMHTISMVEVVVRNAMDRALNSLADKRGWSSWFDGAPLDHRGRADIRKAQDRATRLGSQPAVHGKVVAELTLGSGATLPHPGISPRCGHRPCTTRFRMDLPTSYSSSVRSTIT
jgi:hypothetical protein